MQLARRRFEAFPEPRRCPAFSLADTLMAGLAVCSLTDPSLLAFQRRSLDHNLRTVFGLSAIPSDTRRRPILDEVHPRQLRPLFTDLFRQRQRGKVLEDFVFLEGCYLVAVDGVEYFTSKMVHCQHGLTRQHHNGSVSCYHQMLGAFLVPRDFSEVIALAPEPSQRHDGQQKNDGERNAARRWLASLRNDHPHLPVIVVEDALSSNAPHVRDLQEVGCHFIPGVKRPDHRYLFESFEQRLKASLAGFVVPEKAKGRSSYSYDVNGLSLNEANAEVLVNLLVCLEVEEAGKESAWAWVTDLELTKGNVVEVARGGRTRWRIDNETLNTLKNQGDHFEHNYGHGQKHLSTVLAVLMMAAFLIDQIQQKCNQLFQKAWERKGPKCALWEAIRTLFATLEVGSMREIPAGIAYGFTRPQLALLVEQARVAREAEDNRSQSADVRTRKSQKKEGSAPGFLALAWSFPDTKTPLACFLSLFLFNCHYSPGIAGGHALIARGRMFTSSTPRTASLEPVARCPVPAYHQRN